MVLPEMRRWKATAVAAVRKCQRFGAVRQRPLEDHHRTWLLIMVLVTSLLRERYRMVIELLERAVGQAVAWFPARIVFEF